MGEDDGATTEYPDTGPTALDQLISRETREVVQRVLDGLPVRDRRLIREVLLEERDKDEVCLDLGVDRDYLRVLLHRAKQSFKENYVKSNAQTLQRR